MNNSIAMRWVVGAFCVLLAGPALSLASEATALTLLFKNLDSDGDGQLAAAEIQPEHAALYARLIRTSDADSDGQLSVKEFTQGLQPHRTAKPLAEKPSGELPGADALKLLLIKMDTNGDLRLIAEEIPDQYYSIFERIESRLGGEKDGRIERRELIQSAPKLCQLAKRFAEQQGIDVQAELARLPMQQKMVMEQMDEPPRPLEVLSNPEEAKRMFKEWDADGDGQLTTEEIPEPLAQFFNRLLEKNDGNGDRQLSRKELLAVSKQLAKSKAKRPSPAKVENEVARIFKRFDRNGDQQLSREEAPQRMTSRFDRIDANGNGALERQEVERVVKLLSGMRKSENGTARKPKSQKQRKLGKKTPS